jgi:hypothetical protein
LLSPEIISVGNHESTKPLLWEAAELTAPGLFKVNMQVQDKGKRTFTWTQGWKAMILLS